jgi:myosin heavy subunit
MPGQSQSGVYVRDEHYGWLPARILSSEDETKVVNVEVTVPVIVPRNADSSDEQTDTIPDDCAFSYVKQERKIQLKDYEAETLPLQNMDESGNGIVVPDMCDLPSLHEAAILYNLKSRHEALSPYTRTGDIVIAMNPFQVRVCSIF